MKTRIALCIVLLGGGFVFGVVFGKYNLFPISYISHLRHPDTLGSLPAGPSSVRVDPDPFAYLDGHADIVIIGDSISAAVEWKEVFPDLNITNRAIGGSTIADLRKRESETLGLLPRTIVILVGINDLRWNVPLSTYLEQYFELIDHLRRQSRVIVQSILPVRNPERWPGINEKIQTANNELATWCASEGLSFCDLRPALAPKGYLEEKYSIDGVHLTGEGNRVWMKILKERMRVQ